MAKPLSSDKNSSKKVYPPPFSMRFTDSERKALEIAANGRPLAAYIRWLIFKEEMPEAAKLERMPKSRSNFADIDPDRKEIAKLLGALAKSNIANNINQLAKAANSGSLPVNHDVLNSLKEAVSIIHWMRDSLIKALGLKPHRDSEDDDASER